MMTTTASPSFADTLRQAVRESGKTAYAICQKSGVAQAVLSRFMTGERGINLETAEKFCRALGLELRRAEPPAAAN
jgi:transcriptional regulator with XRE-family HTH domain